MAESKGVKPVCQNLTADGALDLAECLYWSIENVGKVDAEIAFENSGDSGELYAGMTREMPFVGDRYVGRVYVRFKGDGEKRVTLIKITHHC